MSFLEDDDDRVYPSSPSSDRDVRPPVVLVYFGIVQLVALVALLVPDGQALHWVGYTVGAILVPTTISTYRSVDRTRQRSKGYSSPSWVTHYPSLILAAGVALAVAHAYFLALDTRLA